MALVSGFLRQRCRWCARGEPDQWGNPLEAPPVEIPCRWVEKAGWARGAMGPTDTSPLLSYRKEILVDRQVRAGDTLEHEGERFTVLAVETIVDIAGQEQGRRCYA